MLNCYAKEMPLSEFEIKTIEKEVGSFVEKRRPPPHIRDELHLRVPDAASIAYRKLLLGVERSQLVRAMEAGT